MLCCQASASTKTSLGRICHGLGLTLFSSEPSAGAARSCLLKSQPPIPFACGQDDGGPIIQGLKLVGKEGLLAAWRLAGVDGAGMS